MWFYNLCSHTKHCTQFVDLRHAQIDSILDIVNYLRTFTAMNELQSCNYGDVIKNIDTLLDSSGMSRAEYGRHIGLGRSAVSQKLLGKLSFTLKDITATADLFHVSVDALLGREAVK